MSEVKNKALILVIDDDPIFVQTVKAIAEGNGFTFKSSNSAYEGYQLARKLIPDVILLDIYLPDESGLVIFDKIATDELLAYSLTILVSQDHSANLRSVGLIKGAEDFLIKPIDNTELQIRMDVWVKRKQHRQEL